MARKKLTLAGKVVYLDGKPVKVKGRTASPNGLADAVFEGGGVKGVGHVGALAYGESIGLHWVNVAGTSAGAIVAALVAANYSAKQIRAIMDEIDFRKFLDESILDKVPIIGKVTSVLAEKGIYEGEFLESTIERYLAAKNVRTFKDLVIPEEPRDSKYRYRLRVVASDISRGKMLVLPQDIAGYGMKPDDLSVAKAVRMSMSIPFVFEPVSLDLKGPDGRRDRCYVVDGGLLSNYPVGLFDEPGTPSWPTFGFDLRGGGGAPKPARIRGPLSLTMAIFNTMMSAMDKRYIEEKNWDRTIPIRTLGVSVMDFDITKAKRDALYRSGEQGARTFFESWWDWDKHVAARRKNVTMEAV